MFGAAACSIPELKPYDVTKHSIAVGRQAENYGTKFGVAVGLERFDPR